MALPQGVYKSVCREANNRITHRLPGLQHAALKPSMGNLEKRAPAFLCLHLGCPLVGSGRILRCFPTGPLGSPTFSSSAALANLQQCVLSPRCLSLPLHADLSMHCKAPWIPSSSHPTSSLGVSSSPGASPARLSFQPLSS